MEKLIYLLAASYLRHTKIQTGRYRLLKIMRPVGRKIGRALGWRRVRTKHDFVMDLDLQDWIPQDIFLTGEFEPATTAVARKLLKPGDIVVDVGANIGYYSLLFCSCVGKAGHVYSFEPVPKLASALCNNVELNRFEQITLSDLALSDHDGEARFYVGPDDNSGLSSLRPPRESSDTLDVRLARFDGFFTQDKKISLIKIDVEGAELAVLRGMQDYLRSHRPYILLEVTNRFLKEMGDSEESLISFLQDFGYSCYVINGDGIELADLRKSPLPVQWNAIFSAEKIFGDGFKFY